MGEKQNYTIKINEIGTDHIGIGEILKFYNYAKQYRYCQIQLNVSTVNSIDANLSALILAIVHKLKEENKVSVFIILGDGMGVFYRNGLVSHLSGKGNENIYGDVRESTIPLTVFGNEDEDSFCQYLRKDFFGHRGLDKLSLTTRMSLSTHFEEIFCNAVMHANSTYPMYACGQYFPVKKILKFTFVDLGDGFLKKISEQTNGEIKKDKDAILWSTYKLNSTKDVKAFGPGGLGLKELKKYCNENNGSLHICSGNGYVNFIKDKTMEQELTYHLKGSLVNLIFRDI